MPWLSSKSTSGYAEFSENLICLARITTATIESFNCFYIQLTDVFMLWLSEVCLGEQVWCSGESARLPPMCSGFDSRIRRHMWTEFVGSLLCSERFFSGFSPMCSGFDSRIPRHMWTEFVGSLLCSSERFFSGYSGFPLSSKTNIWFELIWFIWFDLFD